MNTFARLRWLAFAFVCVCTLRAAVPEDERRLQTELAELMGRARLLELLDEVGALTIAERSVLALLQPFVARECPEYFRRHLMPYLDHSLRNLVSDPVRLAELAGARRALLATVVFDPTDWWRPATPNGSETAAGPKLAGLWLMVHWGAWAQSGLGRAWQLADPDIPEVERQRRFEFASTFDPFALDPARIVELARAARCDGVVMTTRHLDDVPLFPRTISTSEKSDGLRPLVDALHATGLKFGAYYSLMSFRHPDGGWSPYHPQYVPGFTEAFPDRWARYERDTLADLMTLMEHYEPDVLWLDERWTLRNSGALWDWVVKIKRRYPGLAVNDRGTGSYADFSTYEDTIPKTPITGPWEAVIAISNGPGFWHRARPDRGFKTSDECVELMRSAREHGARLLLSIAPDAQGQIEVAEEQALRALGAWIDREAVVTP